jgi:aminoglycoside phosphotransferase (APT) family kinase protein
VTGPESLDARCRALVAELGLGPASAVRSVRPLTGGVASDIALVDLGERRICAKFALAKLKVAEDWRAPIHRNRAEYAWLEAAGRIAPACVPRLYGRSEDLGGFAMEFISGEGVHIWKEALLAGAPDRGEGHAVARLLGAIHSASARLGFDAAAFRNRDDFHALRIEPYLVFTAGRHPDLAGRLNALARSLYASELALVHGDASPKNILFRAGAPILLDAECATMGDPAFDVAFCLNHLVLKAVHLPATRSRLIADVGAFWGAYAPLVDWEAPAALEARLAALLPALMLARVDGKSPVEYLDEAGRARVRALARPLIAEPTPDLAGLLSVLRNSFEV